MKTSAMGGVGMQCRRVEQVHRLAGTGTRFSDFVTQARRFRSALACPLLQGHQIEQLDVSARGAQQTLGL